ncbi:unnamed protein product [Caenorhabditis brenneri]
MSQAGSFTDVHFDFSGTSVYYHAFKGQKIFYIASPTPEHLKIYKEHKGKRQGGGVLTLCVHPSGLTCDWWEFFDGKICQVAIPMYGT